MASVRCLSVRQPWAWAIIRAGKDTENRTWATKYRGPLLIHAGLRMDDDDCLALSDRIGETALPEEVPLGGIVGVVDLVDCVQNSRSRWAVIGLWHWVLANPKPLPFRALRGRLGLWEVSYRLPALAA
jgi:ASCH domain